MKKPVKVLLVIVCVIAVLCVSGVILYKPIYNIVAPKVFDSLVAKNLDKLIGTSEELSENIISENKEGEEELQTEENSGKKDEENGEDEKTEKPENKSKASANSPKNENNKNGVYKSKTHIGELNEYDLSYLIRVISPADKTQIISILQSCVASSDYPEMARRVKDGLDHADMAYIESYLRSHMTPQQKKAILDIIDKYV